MRRIPDLMFAAALLYNPMLMTGLTRFLPVFACIAATGGAPVLAQPAAPPLSVTSAGPAGEIGSLAEANEIRVRFSEPMVSLGRIPATETAPFFRVVPAIPGTFRWSGKTS